MALPSAIRIQHDRETHSHAWGAEKKIPAHPAPVALGAQHDYNEQIYGGERENGPCVMDRGRSEEREREWHMS